jgi:very-short-patch-repair endonuclease
MNWYEKSRLCGRYRQLKDNEKKLTYEFRDNPTPAEKVLWNILRNKDVLGLKFRRQHKIGQFIVDFYCHSIGLIIEVDGKVHEKRKTEDQIRSRFFRTLGLRVIRFSNKEILNSIQEIKRKIENYISTISLMPPSGPG